MTILDLNTIRLRLDEQFLPLEPALTGFRLLDSKLTPRDIAACEQRLEVRFPQSFKKQLERFDFGDLTIGPTYFCGTGDYLDFLGSMNDEDPYPRARWWDTENRPVDRILVAMSDYFSILLGIESGVVFALANGEAWTTSEFMIADSFEDFLRGIGTAMLERRPGEDNKALANAISSRIGAGQDNRFWLVIAA